MKKLYALALLMGGSMFAGAQTYAVDFAVDIKAVNPLQDTVIIAGSFASFDASGAYTDWNSGDGSNGDPDSAVYAVDPDMDGVWTFTANLPDGTYDYKFLNGVGGWESFSGNRTFTVSGAAVSLDTFCYNVLTPGLCPTTVADTLDFTINIDMNYNCYFDPTTDIVDWAGDINGWAGDTMTDPDGDGVYSLSVTGYPVQIDLTTGLTSFQGKARINSDWGTSESGSNRVYEFGTDTVFPVRCYGATTYGSCAAPAYPEVDITFEVDITQEVPLSDDRVFLIADFTSWQAGALEMFDTDGDGIYSLTVTDYCPLEVYWKYVMGTPEDTTGAVRSEENADFSDIGGCGVDNGSFPDNRYFERTNSDDLLFRFVFNTCNGVAGSISVEEFENETIELKPNPMGERATVELPAGTFNGQVIDITGRVVQTISQATNELVIERNGLQSGVYMLVLTNENGVSNTTKFVIK